ncbi:MAG: hypothetical protein P4L84_07915 [Isosphaeraceae bacterium]|nr:hypothetical protein [Isosphaeraceae bacterium]
MFSIHTLFAYVGPDTFLPVTSALAALAGVFMMFGRAGFRMIFGGGVARVLSGRRRFAGPHAAQHRRYPDAAARLADTSRADD